MAEKYKLIYFNARGRVEQIRMLFALAGVEYEDHRVEFAQWPALKPTTKWGCMPILEVNGEPFGEITAIEHYLANKFKLRGQSALEEFRVDEIVSAFGETLKMQSIIMEKDPAKKEEKQKDTANNVMKPLLAKVTVLKEKNGGDWMVGQSVTLADIYLAVGLFNIDTYVDPSLVSQFPALRKLQEKFNSLPQIKNWIEKRPQTMA